MSNLYAFIGKLSYDEVLNSISNEEELNDFLKKYFALIESTQKESCDLYYNSDEVQTFCNFFKNIFGNTYLLSLEDRFEVLLRNCRDSKGIKRLEHQRYFWWNYDGSHVVEVTHDPTSIIVDLYKTHPDGEILILLPSALKQQYSRRKFLPIIIDQDTDSGYTPSIIRLHYASEENEVSNWILENRTPLIMNKNNKHGENGVGGHSLNKGKKVSRLYTSILKAQELLNGAVGDKRYSKKKVYNYDHEKTKIIAFYYEGETPQNQYHGFHYDTIEEAEEEIKPREVFLELKRRFKL